MCRVSKGFFAAFYILEAKNEKSTEINVAKCQVAVARLELAKSIAEIIFNARLRNAAVDFNPNHTLLIIMQRSHYK